MPTNRRQQQADRLLSPNRSKACFGETPKPALETSALPEKKLMRGGTHEDAIQLETDDWLLSERARIVEGLAAPGIP